MHLVKYPPTDKANPSLLGTGKDVSRPDEGLYYVSIDLMPFALNMPISEFPIPEEGVRIDESYQNLQHGLNLMEHKPKMVQIP